MKKPIEGKKKLKKIMDYTACFAFLMFLQGVGAPTVFATSEIDAKFTSIKWISVSCPFYKEILQRPCNFMQESCIIIIRKGGWI